MQKLKQKVRDLKMRWNVLRRWRVYQSFLNGRDFEMETFKKRMEQLGETDMGQFSPMGAAVKIADRCVAAEKALVRQAWEAGERGTDGASGLSLAETERLALMAGSCGEVAHAVSRILRNGFSGKTPVGWRHRQNLERELGSLRAVIDLMVDFGDVNPAQVSNWRRQRMSEFPRRTRYQVTMMRAGAKTTDEVRAELDLPPIG